MMPLRYRPAPTAWMLLAALACLAAAPAAWLPAARAQDVPFTGQVIEDGVRIHAGAGRAYYQVGELNKGDTVVVEEVIFGWNKIRTPPGVFSYISRAFVDARGNGRTGAVNKDRTDVKAGSSKGPGESYRVQTILNQGDTVRILATEGDYYKIKPPKNAYVFIPPGSVRRLEGRPAPRPQPEQPQKQPSASGNNNGSGNTQPSQPPQNATPDESDQADQSQGADQQPKPSTDNASPAERDQSQSPDTDAQPNAADSGADQTDAPTKDESDTGMTTNQGQTTNPGQINTLDQATPGEGGDENVNQPQPADDDQQPGVEGDRPAGAEGENTTTETKNDQENTQPKPMNASQVTDAVFSGEPLTDDPDQLGKMADTLQTAIDQKDMSTLAARRAQRALTVLKFEQRRAQVVQAGNAAIAESEKPAEVPKEEQEQQREQLPPSVRFDATGVLMTSNVFDGENLPRLYRLVNQGRTIGYIKPGKQINARRMLGQTVGIVGERSRDAATKQQVFTLKKIEVLR